ncbi:NAD(P)H-quinone oxidoreductase subunit 2 b chloroplastic [Phtheirospermum japonicum]|uniref:NAD(P)H-quinone oxidoreductase subunit 2 b chloroplastic n=1 Tax=Phtheirospermum japonicum TaxID=374723 RepID=A0A830AXE6_9LAMI|nr:NAD(P)H-quinone oxidoreductase subunit 2 b chloroplastic [Phtheirospermum japonicum]
MSITTLLFQWREEPMINFLENFPKKRRISTKSFNFLFYYVQLYVFLYPYIECTEMAITEFILFIFCFDFDRDHRNKKKKKKLGPVLKQFILP